MSLKSVFSRMLSLIPLVPGIVQSVEMIHVAAKNGAEKKELAMASLGLATGVASVALPEEKEAIDAATNLASNLIDNVVSFLNATKQMPKPIATPEQIPPASE